MRARPLSALLLLGVAAGNLAMSHSLVAPRALVPLGAAATWAVVGVKDLRVRMAGACITSFVVGALAVPSQGSVSRPLEVLAREVPLCSARGIVLETRGGLGTFGRVDELLCSGLPQPGGVIVFEGDRGFSGSLFILDGQLVPLGNSGFDRARAEAGASASMSGHARFAAPEDPWRAAAYGLRGDLLDAAAVLPPREGALLAGLTIGDTSRIASADEQTYRDTGLSHLVAVSGSNIAIVVGTVMVLMSRMRLWARLLGGLTALALYVTIVGPDASVLRAATMGVFALAALAFGRRHEVLSTLSYALCLLLLVRPEMLTSLGLQLSAAATAGLALWSGRLASFFKRAPRSVGFVLAATLSAQFAVAPLLIHHFERLSLVGPLSNLLAVPAVGAATLLGLGAGFVAALWMPAGELMMRLTYPFVWWIVRVADLTSIPDWSVVDVSAAWAVPVGVASMASALFVLRRSRTDLVTLKS